MVPGEEVAIISATVVPLASVDPLLSHGVDSIDVVVVVGAFLVPGLVAI